MYFVLPCSGIPAYSDLAVHLHSASRVKLKSASWGGGGEVGWESFPGGLVAENEMFNPWSRKIAHAAKQLSPVSHNY